MDGFILVIVLFAGFAIVIRLMAGSMDGGRVAKYIASRGGKVLQSHWTPFGRGWFGEKNDRIYEVRYVDADGNVHEATCKTSMFSGVYFTEDRIVRTAEHPVPDIHTLQEENRRLKERLARLEGRRDWQ
jgi:hypothetical protein